MILATEPPNTGTQPTSARVGAYGRLAVDVLRLVWVRVVPVTRMCTPLGGVVLVFGIMAWVLGSALGWVELVMVAVTVLAAFLLCAAFTAGRTSLRVTVDVRPHRLVAGTPATGAVTATNVSTRRLLPLTLELPVGAGLASFDVPGLAGGAGHEEVFVVPTQRRGVVPVGPATSVRADPVGLLRRAVTWTGVTELFVHPVTVPLSPFGTGLLRDLDGRTTNEMSMSDLAFHTLREYAPGDDRRHIHWRSSAKSASTSDSGRFLVRQFLDTRRSQLLVVVDGDPAVYLDPDDFETAVSSGASIAVRALRDDVDTAVVVAGQVAHDGSVQRTMDCFSRAELGGAALPDATPRGTRLAPDTTIAVLVTGAGRSVTELRSVVGHFAPEVRVNAIRVCRGEGAALSSVGPLTVLTLPALADLPALLRGTDSR